MCIYYCNYCCLHGHCSLYSTRGY